MFSKMMYEKNEKPLPDLFKDLETVNVFVEKTEMDMMNFLYSIIDLQLQIINLNLYVSDYMNSTFSDLISSLCYRNIITILSAMQLIKSGYFGSAKILFRNIYESLLIGKLFGITKNEKQYHQWINGEPFSVKKEVFSKLKQKPSKETLEFWDILNKYTHSTVYSQNFSVDDDVIISHLQECHTIISTLLDMNFHLLNIYVSKYHNYYLNYYFRDYYRDKKSQLKELLIKSRKMIDPRCQVVIRDYSSNWKLKEEN